MPVYEYYCTKCGEGFELLIRSEREQREAACPKCQTPKIERRPSVFATHGAPAGAALPRGGGGCGRCGDPAGPCNAE
jgi:putative FmdB family regulatory protein